MSVTSVCIEPTCGVVFEVSDHIDAQARRPGSKRLIYCPNGHSAVYTETEAQRLQKTVEYLRSELDATRTAYETRRRQANSLRGTITRLKRQLAEARARK